MVIFPGGDLGGSGRSFFGEDCAVSFSLSPEDILEISKEMPLISVFLARITTSLLCAVNFASLPSFVLVSHASSWRYP